MTELAAGRILLHTNGVADACRDIGPFAFSGLAALSDLESTSWQTLYAALQVQQAEFLSKQAEFRSPEYGWPADSLHWWSRVWEYPYTYYHLSEWASRRQRPGPLHVVDFGSGVTFFPYAVARLGCTVTCTDIDAVCEKDFKRASHVISAGSGGVGFRLAAGSRLPFGDGEVDAVFSVSVIEHLPDIAGAVNELARILKPDGLLVLTFDLDLRGDQQLGIDGHSLLQSSLAAHFNVLLPERTIHPRNMLTSDQGPCPTKVSPRRGRVARVLSWLKLLPPPQPDWYLAVQGKVLCRRGGTGAAGPARAAHPSLGAHPS